MILQILEALLITSAVSIDALVASFSYGINKIKIPFKSAVVISAICTIFLTVSFYVGKALSNVISEEVTLIVSCCILVFIGILKLFDSFIKQQIKKQKTIDKNIKFNFLSLKFILKIYTEPETADVDESKRLSIKESIPLAIALSIDSLAVGLGSGLASTRAIFIITLSLIMGLLAIFLGSFIGKKVAQKTSINLSWISGVILILLGISKIFI